MDANIIRKLEVIMHEAGEKQTELNVLKIKMGNKDSLDPIEERETERNIEILTNSIEDDLKYVRDQIDELYS